MSKLCSNCGNVVFSSEKFCGKCGSATETKISTCSVCTKEISADNIFCPSCGTRNENFSEEIVNSTPVKDIENDLEGNAPQPISEIISDDNFVNTGENVPVLSDFTTNTNSVTFQPTQNQPAQKPPRAKFTIKSLVTIILIVLIAASILFIGATLLTYFKENGNDKQVHRSSKNMIQPSYSISIS